MLTVLFFNTRLKVIIVFWVKNKWALGKKGQHLCVMIHHRETTKTYQTKALAS